MQTIRKTVLENLPVGLLIIAGDGKIMEASSSACHILGCPVQGFVGNSFGELFLSQAENAPFTSVVLDAIQKETPTIKRLTAYHTPNGEKKHLSVLSSVQREDGKLSTIVVIIEDLTQLHKLYEREKRILAQNHRLATERAESLIKFASSVAHQIRNPITAIAGFSRLLERTVGEAEQGPLEAIQDETRKLEAMVRAVAEYSAIAIDHIAPVNLWIIIEEAKRRIENHAAVAGQGIVWVTECPDMNIPADKTLMITALSELLLNGAEFAGPGSRITICAHEDDTTISINVTDNGPGFTADDLEMAFDPFYTTKSVGAGMGLTRAKRILVEHQGTVEISNTEDGARGTLSFPANHL